MGTGGNVEGCEGGFCTDLVSGLCSTFLFTRTVIDQLLQTLVSSILLRPHPTEFNAPHLSATSHIRVQVELSRLELLKWIGKRWLAIRQERAFDLLEGWALKEISDRKLLSKMSCAIPYSLDFPRLNCILTGSYRHRSSS